MTRPELRSTMLALPLNEPRSLSGVAVVRRSLGWSVEGGQAVSVETACNLVENLLRIRAPRA